MDFFAIKPEAERRDIFQEAASRRDVLPIIIEKDFWVCWTLKRLFSNLALAPFLTFKGGTSLSKAYGLIERFSEDIDLTISREAPFVRDGESPVDTDKSNERKRRIETLGENAQRFVAEILLPCLEKDIYTAFGGAEGWSLTLDALDKDHQTILFYYPKTFVYTRGLNFSNWRLDKSNFAETGYIKPVIKLEFGARGEPEPRALRAIRPYVAETFPNLFEVGSVNVSTLAVERTFWEKATILHALHHGSKLLPRMSRHYYDVYMMEQRGVADAAVRDAALLEQVVRNTIIFFNKAKASYETAKIGSLCLIPPETILAALKKDYEAMSEMFMGEYPDFDTVMAGLAKLEQRLNGS